jgi:hypothetical protein
MSDEVGMNHRHADGERPMRHDDDERIDGLRLREFSCDCGYSAAVLTRMDSEQQGKSWPFQFRSQPPVS